MAGSSTSGATLIARISGSHNTQPNAQMSSDSRKKKVVLVPTTCLACWTLPAPMYCPTSTVAAIDRPNTPPSSRNITILAFAVADSAASPR